MTNPLRRIEKQIQQDLSKKMVILSGPRQCGKTTLSHQILKSMKSDAGYMNWDATTDRKKILANELPTSSKIWVFDELHKYRPWRNWLKGVFDTYRNDHRILVAGSGRLELYGRGGDSLQGRYFPHHLHPFTVSELMGLPFSIDEFLRLPHSPKNNSLKELLELSGFPEPLFSGSSTESNRWRLAYGERLVQEDIRSLEQIQDLSKMEILYDRLQVTVGSVLSLNSLREDLETHFNTIKNWIQIFERLYACFRIYPYGYPKIKAVKKEAKLYLFDWARVEAPGPRLENLVAAHLWRLCDYARDLFGRPTELRFWRTSTNKEVDFIVLQKGKPWFAVECKSSDTSVSPALIYFLERHPAIPCFQIVDKEGIDHEKIISPGKKIRIVSASKFLANLP